MTRIWQKALALWFLGWLTAEASVLQPWKTRPADGKERSHVAALAQKERGLLLPISLPSKRDYVLLRPSVTLNLSKAESMILTIALPKTMPAEAVLTVFSQDHDYLWRQIRMPVTTLKRSAEGVCDIEVPLIGMDAVNRWQCVGHSRAWNGLTPASLLELGFRFELDGPVKKTYEGEAFLKNVSVRESSSDSLGDIRDFSVNTLRPAVGTALELSFRLTGWVRHPYDPKHFSIRATVTMGEAKTAVSETVPGFYVEDFIYDEREADKSRCLQPHGEPCFRIRYVPRHVGKHRVTVTVLQGSETLTVPPFDIEAIPGTGTYRGFIHVDAKHPDFFAHEDGTVFRGLGVNVRSPFDDRYFGVAPYSMWKDQGLQAYQRLFKRYHDVGINVAEVWMCSWWLALEWTNNDRGYHGVGHYNQYRAWMLDRIMALAEQYGVHIILVLNNHGKFGMTYDTEWKHNPYNQACGGYLKRCEDYFADARAKADFKKTADYIVARWGASSNLLAWKLFTEVDLTGQNIQAYLTDKNIPAWHREMGQYLKSIDVYKHPVTTHWMLNYGRIDRRVATLKEVDFLSTDAYYDQGAGTKAMISLISGGADFGRQHKKPMVITEFGGSSYADSMRNLMNQVEVGLWTGFFQQMGILPMYWWFGLIEDKNLYGYYRCLSRFEANEDRRTMTHAKATFVGGKGNLQVHALNNQDRMLAWVMDSEYFYANKENARPRLQQGRILQVPVTKAGSWTVEFWNPATGEIMSRCQLVSKEQDRLLSLHLPEFRRSLAIKVLRQK